MLNRKSVGTKVFDSKRFQSVEYIDKGWSKDRKYCVTENDGTKYLLRISSIERYSARKELYEMLKRTEQLGVPMCKPIDFGTCEDSSIFKSGVYILQSWVDGDDLEMVLPTFSEEEQYSLGHQAGNILRKIHTIPAPKSQEEWAVRFNKKIDDRIKIYKNCGLQFNGDNYVLDYIEQCRHLLANRPQCFQHGDYHTGNIMLENGKLTIIDFDRNDFGDPWEEFNRTVFSAKISPFFASGQIHGYFYDSPIHGADPPAGFFELVTLYISFNVLAAIPWAIPYGQADVDIMMEQTQDVLKWYNNMHNCIPSWYVRHT